MRGGGEVDEVVFHTDIYYTGCVQGVGFRYQTYHIAKEFEVSGYVMNLTDGRVLVEAEGQEGEVSDFKREIETQMVAFIRSAKSGSRYRPRAFSGFTIRSDRGK